MAVRGEPHATGSLLSVPKIDTGESVEGEGVRRSAGDDAMVAAGNLFSPSRLQIKPETGSNCLGRMTTGVVGAGI